MMNIMLTRHPCNLVRTSENAVFDACILSVKGSNYVSHEHAYMSTQKNEKCTNTFAEHGALIQLPCAENGDKQIRFVLSISHDVCETLLQ